jgi:predicted Zn-dependent peptidase
VAAVEGITEYRLPNGLRILLAPDDAQPTTTVNMTYLVGSRHENYGETGMAHLLEHLMFKGTPSLPGRTIPTEFARRGMQFNGTTAQDRTNISRPLQPATTTSTGRCDGSGPHGQQLRLARRPRQRDDGGAQDGDR